MKSILDKGFRYTSAAATDIRKTFRRIRRAQAASTPAVVKREVKPAAGVIRLRRGRAS